MLDSPGASLARVQWVCCSCRAWRLAVGSRERPHCRTNGTKRSVDRCRERARCTAPVRTAGNGHTGVYSSAIVLTLGFHGAAGTVTGSKFLLRADGKRLLVDCGLFQGLKELRLRNWQPPPFNPSSVDAVILTHAHIDHSGYLPAAGPARLSRTDLLHAGDA